jgi:hypothetical protein
MRTALERDNTKRFLSPENSHVFRNDILLPKSPFSCIVVKERGLRICPKCRFLPEQTSLNATRPQQIRSDMPIVKSKII